MDRPVIYVDADACPVKDEVVRVATRYGVPVKLVANGGLRPSRDPLVDVVMVPEGSDAADKWIAERITPRDLCVTTDVPLAARCVEAGAEAVRPDGTTFTASSIGQQLAVRDLMADLRAANPLATGGSGRTFGRRERSAFLQTLDRLVRRRLAAPPPPAGASR